MLEKYKSFYNFLISPIAKFFLRIGLTPNSITIFGLILFIISSYFCLIGKWYFTLIFVICGSIMDGIDGVMARIGEKKSTFGAVLDSTSDRITEMAILGSLLFFYLYSSLPYKLYAAIVCYISLCVSLLISYIKARCEGEGIKCNKGIIQRPERLILISIGFLLGYFQMFIILCILSLVGTITVFERLLEAKKTPPTS